MDRPLNDPAPRYGNFQSEPAPANRKVDRALYDVLSCPINSFTKPTLHLGELPLQRLGGAYSGAAKDLQPRDQPFLQFWSDLGVAPTILVVVNVRAMTHGAVNAWCG